MQFKKAAAATAAIGCQILPSLTMLLLPSKQCHTAYINYVAVAMYTKSQSLNTQLC